MKLPKGWKSKKVGCLFDVQLGKMLNETARSNGEQQPYLTNYNVQWGRFDLSKLNEMHFSERDKSKFALKKGDLVVCEGGEVGRCAIWREALTPCFFQKTLHRLRPKNGEIVPEFMFAYMLSIAGSKRLSDLTTQSSIAHLTREQFCKLEVILPPLPEQRKIADILSTWDEALEKLDALIAAKERRKKGLMRHLHAHLAEQTKVGHSMHQLGDLVERVTRRNANGDLNVLTISAQDGLVSQKEYFKRIVAGADLSNYYLLKHGEFAYNRSTSNGYPYGAIKRLDKYPTGVVSTLYLCFALKKKAPVLPNYLCQYFDAGCLNIGLRTIAKEGARAHGLLNVTTDEFFGLGVFLPPLNDQRAIADILDACDEELRLLRAQRAAIDQQKRGLMQKLLTGKIRVENTDRQGQAKTNKD